MAPSSIASTREQKMWRRAKRGSIVYCEHPRAKDVEASEARLHRLSVRTEPFHGSERGSTPRGATHWLLWVFSAVFSLIQSANLGVPEVNS